MLYRTNYRGLSCYIVLTIEVYVVITIEVYIVLTIEVYIVLTIEVYLYFHILAAQMCLTELQFFFII